MNFDVNSDTVISAATAFLPQPVEICRALNHNSEAVEICRNIIMEDVLGDLLDNLEALEAKETSESNVETSTTATSTLAPATVEAPPKTFFKTLSFYDDPDDDPMLPFESFFETEVPDGPLTEVPSEFTQPFFSSSETPTVSSSSLPDSEASQIVTSILDAILDSVPPRKIATVHPFSLNNKDEELVNETVDSSSVSGLRLAGFATDPNSNSSGLASSENEEPARPAIKFANFAVDPGTPSSGVSSSGGIKLANFAKDPDASSSSSSSSWHTRLLLIIHHHHHHYIILAHQGRGRARCSTRATTAHTST